MLVINAIIEEMVNYYEYVQDGSEISEYSMAFYVKVAARDRTYNNNFYTVSSTIVEKKDGYKKKLRIQMMNAKL